MSKVININSDSFQKEVLEAKVPVLVDFWAPWCRPCQMMGPILEDLANEIGDKAKVIKVDVDDPENGPLAMEYQIRSIPSMKVFKDGKVIQEFVGMRDKEDLLGGLGL